MNHKKQLLRSLWLGFRACGLEFAIGLGVHGAWGLLSLGVGLMVWGRSPDAKTQKLELHTLESMLGSSLGGLVSRKSVVSRVAHRITRTGVLLPCK